MKRFPSPRCASTFAPMILFESEYTGSSLMKSITRASLISLIVAFAAQLAWARGHSTGGGAVHVGGYHRSNGTYVHAYNRAAPGTASSTGSFTRPNASLSNSTTGVSSATTTTNTTRSAYNGVPYTQPTYTSSARVSSSLTVQRDAHGRIKRSESAKREFMRQSGHPNGWPGHVVDHKIALKRGGCDCPQNMQWQTIQDAKAKDKSE
jgi:hypothetical protein